MLTATATPTLAGWTTAIASILLLAAHAHAAVAEGYVGAQFSDLDGIVVVATVERLSPAAQAGLAKGDTLLTIAGKPIKTATDAQGYRIFRGRHKYCSVSSQGKHAGVATRM